MNLAILHLSDIHIRASTDPIIARVTSIAAASARIISQADAWLVLCTGDVAFGGAPHEYAAAAQLFDRLRETIVGLVAPTKAFHGIVTMPGNHDCDFGTPDEDRAKTVDRISKLSTLHERPEPNDVEACLQAQKAFLQFRHELESRGLSPTPTAQNEFVVRYDIAIGVHSICLRCCNTAWMSSKEEVPGRLLFPANELVVSSNESHVVAITCLHHPIHWLHPDNRRAVRASLEATSDIIITAHEHASGERAVDVRHVEATYLEVEAPVLQDSSDENNSSFQVIELDLASRRRRRSEFVLATDGDYAIDPAHDIEGDERWESLIQNQLRIRQTFSFTEPHQEYLDEIELSLEHGEVEDLRLSDLFVWPDVREVLINPNYSGKLVRGDKLCDFLLGMPQVLVTGDNDCGKTALAKRLCVEALRMGYVPVLLRATESLPRGRKLLNHIEKAMLKQFGRDAIPHYRELPRDRRVLIVDDLHVAAPDAGVRRDVISRLHDHAAHVVMFGDDAEINLEEATTGEGTYVPRVRIQEFGYVQRGELVERWVGLAGETRDRERTVADLDKRIETVLGRNYVPSYPVYILALLQASAGLLAQDTRIGTYGAYYELLIRGQLLRQRTQKDFSTIVGYLSFVADRMYAANRAGSATRGQYATFHAEYENWADMRLNSDALLADLSQRQMLLVRQDEVSFRYPYVFYYFLANFIRDNVGQERVKALIADLAQNTHKRENADILLFVAHLTRDRYVVESLLAAAADHYKDMRPLRDITELALVRSLGERAVEVAYQEKAARDARRENRQAKDEAREREEIDDSDLDEEVIRPVVQLTAALRTMQVLGQVLRNFPGQLEGTTKLEIAQSCYELGARAWAFLFEALEKHGEALAADLTNAILAQEPQLTKTALGEKVKRITMGIVYISAYGFIKRIAQSIGSDALSVTFDKLVAVEDCETVRLVKAAIVLEHSPTPPELEIGNMFRQFRNCPLSSWLIQEFVVEYLTFFGLDAQTKQRMCALVDVKYKNVAMPPQRRRELKRPRK